MFSRLSFFFHLLPVPLLAIVLVLVSEPPIIAQVSSNPEYEVRRVFVREGMTNQTVTALSMDCTGTLWIGTLNGLYTFDGLRLNRFDIKDAANQKISYLPITGLESDSMDQNLLFVSTEMGIFAIDPVERKTIPDSALGLPAGFFQTCKEIKKSVGGFYWLLSHQTLYKLVKKAPYRYDCHPRFNLPTNKVSGLVADPSSSEGVWILLLAKEMYYLNANVLEHFILPENKANPSSIQGLIQWLYTEKGIFGWDHARNVYRFNVEQKRIDLANDQYDLPDFFPELERVDRFLKRKPALICYASILAGQELLGTDQGLFIIRKKVSRFNSIEPLRGEEIRGIHTDTSNNWYVGTYNGMYKGHLGQNKVQRFKTSHIWAFLPLTDNLYMLAQESPKGIVFWDAKRNIPVFSNDLLSLIDTSVDEITSLSLCKDTKGTIWAGTYKHLLWTSEKTPFQFRFWTDGLTGKPMQLKFVRVLLPDSNSGIWVGHENGLLRIVYNELLQRYETDPAAPDLNGIAVSDLYQDRQQRMWIATKGKGIACLDLKNLKIPTRWYNSENGLCNDFTCRIEGSHNDEVLWISTHNGLSRFNQKSGTFHSFYEGSGIPGNEFNSAASARFSDGTLLFGGVSGLIIFHPDSIPDVDYQHKTILSGAIYYDETSKQLATLSISSRAKISLSPYPEYFELRLGSTEFVEPEKVRFRYRMQGLSELWTYTQGVGDVKFIRLAPGNYVFEAQAISLDGHFAKPVLLPIFVSTPYYETWWFKTLLVACSLGIGYLAYLYRVRRILQVQHMRQQIADDLHDDIGNKLCIISIVAQKMVKSNPENVSHAAELNKLIEVSRNALRSLHTMIWSIDSKKERLSSLITRMQDFADGYLHPLGIKFRFELNEPISNRNMNLQARHHIIMIYQELLTNMVKHTHPTLITISIKPNRDVLHLQIANHHQMSNVPGFDASTTNRGLSSIERRLNRIKGEFTWREPTEDRQEITLVVPHVFKRS